MLALMPTPPAQTDDPARALLRQLLEKKGISFKAASDHVRKNQTYIQQYLEKRSPKILPEDVRASLAALLEVPQEALRTGQFRSGSFASSVQVSSPESILYPAEWPRDVPVRGAAAAGDDGLFDFNGQIIDHVKRPPRLAAVRDAYALYVMGSSMSPWRENGGLVYVHPHQPASISDYVVVQLHPQTDGDSIPAYVKRLVRRTATEIRLHQFNEPKDIPIPTKRVASIHRVIDWGELLGL